jgi:hypothetical protein
MPITSTAARHGPVPWALRDGKERRRVGGSSRRRSLLGLVRPDRDRQAMRSYAPVVNEMSAVRWKSPTGTETVAPTPNVR